MYEHGDMQGVRVVMYNSGHGYCELATRRVDNNLVLAFIMFSVYFEPLVWSSCDHSVVIAVGEFSVRPQHDFA